MPTGLRLPETARLNGSDISLLHREPPPPILPTDQLDLLRLLATGLSDQAIGRRLDMSRRTVQRRVRSLMDLFGVQTRFQLGMRAASELKG